MRNEKLVVQRMQKVPEDNFLHVVDSPVPTGMGNISLNG